MNPPSGAMAAPEVAHLAALIREQAEAEIQEITRSAEERAGRLRAAAVDEVAAIDADARREGEARGRRQAAALLAEAETRGHREWLWARERFLDDVLARVATQLAQLPVHADSVEPLMHLVEEGLAAVPQELVRVRIAREYEALVGRQLVLRLTAGDRACHVEADAIPGGGVIVETEAGRLRFDNSFAARLRRLHDELRGAAAALLFAE
jgi:vacuolar-type H+-ATPase subunit E/Vma4